MTVTPERTTRIIHAILMSGFMSTALSGVFTWLEFGFTTTWLTIWFKSILIAWPIALGLDTIAGTRLRHLAATLAEHLHQRTDQSGSIRPEANGNR